MVSPNTLLITERKMPKYEGEIQLAGSLRAARRRHRRRQTLKIKALVKAGVAPEVIINGPDISEQYAALPPVELGKGDRARRRQIQRMFNKRKRS